MDKYIPGIGLSAGSFMLKYNELDKHIYSHDVRILPGDDVNVFINFECILRNITLHKNLQDLVNFYKQDVVIELESSILNLIAHYKIYFKGKCNAKLFFYYTSLDSKGQQMTIFNKYYRSFYQNRFSQNPQYKQMGNLLIETIIPEVKLILEHVPNCYFIESNTFDSSLIPIILSKEKNIVISGDSFDTLYFFNHQFITIYIKGRFGHRTIISEIPDSVQSIITHDNPFDLSIFNSALYYKLLLSIKGSKIRNISSTKGFGYVRFMKLLSEGIEKNIVLKDFESLESIIQLFPKKYQDEIKLAFQCTDIDTQYNLLNDIDKENITGQVIDRTDPDSLEALNNKRFMDFQINLQGLLN
jgi:hypothetical protein